MDRTFHNRRIRLLFLCNSAPVIAGTEKTALMLQDGLDRDRFDIRFILNGRGPFYDALRERDADLECFPCDRRYSLSWHRNVVASLEERPADIIHLHASRLNALFLRRHTEARFVERLNMHRHSSFFYPMQWGWLDRLMARCIDHFILVSESLREHFLKRGYPADKMSVVYNGIEVPESPPRADLRAELDLPSKTPLVGTVGRLTRQKGMMVFMEAARLIAQKGPEVHFIVAGEGELRDQLETQARQSGMEDRVHFLGYRDDALGIMNDLDVMLYLSRWEPFANTILEAMAVGTAIVATEAGGNAEAIEDGESGRLVPVDAPSETGDVTLELLRDERKRRNLETGARRRVRRWSVENMIRGHEEVYEKLARND